MNEYYEKVSRLYRDFQAGSLTSAQTLERKGVLFAELQRACAAIAPEPVSFNKCPAAMNNAGLAFDRTYTAHYPMLHDLYTLLGRRHTRACLDAQALDGRLACQCRERR